jgi:DNA-binding CsgD family transcriptional regulator
MKKEKLIQKITELLAEGLSVAIIANKVKRKRQTVYKIISKNSLKINKQKKVIDNEQVLELLKAGNSVKQICDILGCTKPPIYSKIKALKLKRQVLYS